MDDPLDAGEVEPSRWHSGTALVALVAVAGLALTAPVGGAWTTVVDVVSDFGGWSLDVFTETDE